MEYSKLSEWVSKFKNENLKLKDRIEVLQECLSTSNKSTREKMRNYFFLIEASLKKDYERKISIIIKQYQSEFKSLKSQYDKARIEAVRATNIISKIVRLNYSQEMFITEIK